jgi:acetylornithine/succinyldiaminopimelate/putrescine aminotransferase
MPSATTTPGNAAAADYLAPVFAQYPIEVVSAQGVWLRNSHGERVLDLYGGHAVVGLGYAHPSWTAALADQAHLCNFQTNAVAMSVRASRDFPLPACSSSTAARRPTRTR